MEYLLGTLTGMAGIISAFAKGKTIPRVIPKTDTGECTQQQYDFLTGEVTRLCKKGLPTACRDKQLDKLKRQLRSSQGKKKAKDVVIPKELIEERLNNNIECEKARQAVQDNCYPGNPTKKHEKEIADLRNNRQICLEELAKY